MTIYDAACDYAREQGFHVFPCHTLEGNACSCGNAACQNVAKHPLTEHGVKDATRDVLRLERYFTGDYANANVALATGEPSGVFVLDVDDAGALASLEASHAPLPRTWVVQTGSGGRHYYFRFNDDCKALKNAVKFNGSLDVRTTGGYVLLPPSLHVSGQRYRWIVSPDDCELANAPAWLLTLTPKHSQASVSPASHEHEQETLANEPFVGSFTFRRATTILERLSLYLDRCPPAISGQGGHNATYAVVCRCVELFGSLSDDNILLALQSWNSRCAPPWADSELRHKLSEARRKCIPPSAASDDDESRDVGDADVISPTINANAFVGVVGDIVKAIEPQTEADSAAVLLTLLTCFGNAVGNSPAFSVGGDEHHPNLFACLVGDTASGKGQAWGIASYVMRQIDADWASGCIAYGLASGEGLIERVKDDEIDDGQSSNVLRLPPTKRLLCYEPEAARPIHAMRREGCTLSPVLRSAWDNNVLEVNTRTFRLRASNAFVSLVAHITPGELQKMLSGSVETFNGFANRFLWACCRSTKSLPDGGNIHVVDSFVGRLASALTKAKAIRQMDRSPDAKRLWESVYPALKAGSVMAAERGRPNVLRLSMIYALQDGVQTIERQHLEAALSVWRYCEESALILFDGDSLALRLRSIVRRQRGVLRSELRHAVSHATPTERFNAALDWLLRRGDVVCVPCYEERQAERYYPGLRPYVPTSYDGPNTQTQSCSFANAYVPTSYDLRESVNNSGENLNESAYVNDKRATPALDASASVNADDSANACVPRLTLAQLIDWRNANAIRFVRLPSGRCWVTQEQEPLLTPAIRQALIDNQETLNVFVEAFSDIEIEDVKDDDLNTPFLNELNTFITQPTTNDDYSGRQST